MPRGHGWEIVGVIRFDDERVTEALQAFRRYQTWPRGLPVPGDS